MDPVEHLRACGGSDGLATTADLRAAGVASAALSRAVAAGRLVRVLPRVYGLHPLAPWPARPLVDGVLVPAARRRVRAVTLSRGPWARASGRTAALLHGWPLLVEPRAVEVAVPHGGRLLERAGARSTTTRGHRVALLPVGGLAPLPAQPARETALELLRTRPLLEAVVAVDSALRARAVAAEQLAVALDAGAGVTGAARARRALGLCDARAESVLESVARVLFLRAGLPGLSTQRTLLAGGRVVRVDVLFEHARLVVELDGSRWHAEPARDRLRDNALVSAGWRVLRYTWADVVHDGDRVVAEVAAALSVAALGAPAVRAA